MALTNLSKIAAALPANTIDKIVWANQVSGSRGASGTDSFGIGIAPSLGFPFGIYSTDGGATYTDFGYYSFSSKFTIKPATQGTISYNNAGTVSVSWTITGAINWTGFIGLIIPSASSLTMSQPATTTGKIAYKSGGNFQKLFSEGSFTQPVAGAATTTIAHNLGYVPQVRAYTDDGNNIIRFLNSVGTEAIKIDENNLTFALGAWGGPNPRNIYYRIYYET